MSVWLFNNLEAAKANPPYRETYDEDCQSGGHELDEHAYRFVVQVNGRDRDQFYCSGCTRERLLQHYRKTPDNDLAEPAFELYEAERCDGCGLWKCGCPDE